MSLDEFLASRRYRPAAAPATAAKVTPDDLLEWLKYEARIDEVKSQGMDRVIEHPAACEQMTALNAERIRNWIPT